MAFGDLLEKYSLHPIVTNGRTASIDMSMYVGRREVRNYFYLYGIFVRNTTSSNITLTNPTVIVNGNSVTYSDTSITITPNTVRMIGKSQTSGSFNQVSIVNTISLSLGSNIPNGIVFDSTTTQYDNQAVIDVPNAGASFGIVYSTVSNRPSGITLVGEANIYEDIIITGNIASGTQYFGDISRDYSYSSKPIRIRQGYTDRTILRAGYFEDINKTSVPITSFLRVPNDTRSYGGSYSESLPIKLIAKKPTLSSLSLSSILIESPITISWVTMNQSKYELEALQNGTVVFSKAETINRNNFTMPANTINNAIPTVFRVRVMKNGNIAWSEWSEITRTLEYNKPTISNLTVIGEFYEKVINTNWRSAYQDRYEYELYYNNVKIKDGTGGIQQDFDIPPNTFTGTLPASVRIRTIRDIGSNTLYSEWQERSISLKEITPTLSNLRLSGSNIDLELTFSWDSTDQEKYEVEVLKDSTQEVFSSGGIEKQVAYPHSTFTVGLHKFRVRVAYKDRWTDWKELNTTLAETLPSIGVLEPDGVIVERDDPIRIWWTSQNQSKWQIKVDGELLTYTGKIEKEKILPPATLSTGPHTIVLTVTYITSSGLEKPITKVAEFIVQGKPPTPTITSPERFATNRPTITCDTQDHQGYLLDVLLNDKVIYTTGWQNGLIVDHKVMDYLPNGTYIVRVKVMNQYSLESDYGSKQFTISTDLTTQINLNSMIVSNYVSLSWDNIGDKFDKFYILRNGMVIAKTIGTNFDDYTAHKECIYAIRGITSNDVFKDSNKAYECVTINRSIIATVDNLSNMMEIVCMTNNNKFSGNLSLSHSLIYLTGRENPISIFGEHKTNKYNLKLEHCNDLFKFIEMYSRCKVFCYRDDLDKIFFTIPTLPYKRDSIALDFEVDIAAIQVDYSEVVDYD